MSSRFNPNQLEALAKIALRTMERQTEFSDDRGRRASASDMLDDPDKHGQLWMIEVVVRVAPFDWVPDEPSETLDTPPEND